MTTWSGLTNHLAIGYDVWTDGYDTYTPSINVYIQISIRNDNWPFNDDQSVALSGSTSATWNYHNGMGNSQSMVIGTATIAGQGQSYGGGPTYSFHAQVNGNYLGAGPAIDFSFTLPARPTRAPSPPPSGPAWANITATSATYSFPGPADNGGLNPDAYTCHVATNSSVNPYFLDSYQNTSVGGLAPNTTYWGQGFWHNGSGWSGGSAITAFTTNAYQLGTPVWSNIGPTNATLTWGNPPTSDAASQYNLQIATDSAFTQIVGNFTSGWSTNFGATGLTPATTYYSRVRASTSTGWGVFSATSSAKTLSGAKIMRNGTWIDAPAYIYRNGTWVAAAVYKNRNGTWTAGG